MEPGTKRKVNPDDPADACECGEKKNYVTIEIGMGQEICICLKCGNYREYDEDFDDYGPDEDVGIVERPETDWSMRLRKKYLNDQEKSDKAFKEALKNRRAVTVNDYCHEADPGS